MQAPFAAPPVASTSSTPAGTPTTAGPKPAKRGGRERDGSTAPLSGGIKPAKLRLKIADSAREDAMYAQRTWDRDVDSDREEPMHVEEQFILRLPTGAPLTKKVGDMVSTRELGTRKGTVKFEGEPWFKFRDARRAIFGFGKPDDIKRSEVYQAKLVDLPCIIESHKTLDMGKHLFKAGDIVQMLIVDGDEPVKAGQDPAEKDVQGSGLVTAEDYVWDSGLTPPMAHVRKRRFRKRANRRTIEAVERRVETLLAKDQGCDRVDWDLIDPADEEPPANESLGAPTPGRSDLDDGDHSTDQGSDDLAAQLEKGLEGVDDESDTSRDEEEVDEGGSDSDMAGLFDAARGEGGSDDELVPGPEDGEEETPEKAEARRRARLLADEVRDLEGTIQRRRKDIAAQANPILKNRMEDSLRKLLSELELKRQQLEQAVAAPVTSANQDADADEGEADVDVDAMEVDAAKEREKKAADADDEDDDEDGLFGGEDSDDDED